jgi:hypothetical protein
MERKTIALSSFALAFVLNLYMDGRVDRGFDPPLIAQYAFWLLLAAGVIFCLLHRWKSE